jgi:hypothetical protein
LTASAQLSNKRRSLSLGALDGEQTHDGSVTTSRCTSLVSLLSDGVWLAGGAEDHDSDAHERAEPLVELDVAQVAVAALAPARLPRDRQRLLLGVVDEKLHVGDRDLGRHLREKLLDRAHTRARRGGEREEERERVEKQAR